MRHIALLLFGSLLSGQVLTPVPIAPSTQTFYSYSPASEATPPIGAQFLLTFPGQATGSQIVIPHCATYSALQYSHYTYTGSSPAWAGPVSGPVLASSPTKFYMNTNSIPAWSGIRANMAWEGGLGSNDDTTNHYIIQAIFFATDNCFEYGPEVGFYKLLFHPGDPTEEGTIVFYYAMNGNCQYVAPDGSCRDRTSGVSLIPTTVSQNISLPASTVNSAGGKNFIFSAYLTSATNFHITITDPYTGVNVVSPVNVAVNPTGFFGDVAAQMYSTGIPGYLATTQQRTSPAGGVTDSVSNPLKLTIFGLAQLAYFASPISAATAPTALHGWCERGNSAVAAPQTVGGSPTIRKYQQSYPQCTVTVYTAGTTTPATIYSDGSSTPLANPFTANTDGSWKFYANDGNYDVNFTGGGLASPFTLGGYQLFNGLNYQPANFFATHEIGVTNGTFSTGWVIPPGLAANLPYILPTTGAQGCLFNNGLGTTSWVNCTQPTAAGASGNIQFNNGSNAFAASSNLTWDNSAKTVTITGSAATPTLVVNGGWVQSAGGFISSANSWQGINTNTDGALLRGLALGASTAGGGNTGGYVNLAPLAYANHPNPLNGLGSFGAHSGLLWVSALNDMAGDVNNSLNTNLYINATGGVQVCQASGPSCVATRFNAIQVPNGGMYALSFSALNYINAGNHNGIPSNTTGDTFNAGAIYYDTALAAFRGYNGSSWQNLGSGGGGGGSPGGPVSSIQFNNTSFGGSSNFTWDNTLQTVTIQATGAGAAGLAVGQGFIQADAGFLAAVSTNYNSIQSPNGGVLGRSLTSIKYTQVGNSNGVPTVSTGDTFNKGAIYYDTGSNSFQGYDGTSWSSFGGGTGTPGGPNTAVQINSAGAFGGSANLTYAAQLLTAIASGAGAAGIAVQTGFAQADAGFIATSGTCNVFNCLQAPTGGSYGLSHTSLNYTQLGNHSGVPSVTSGDSFHAGAAYWDTGTAALQVYNGATWVAIAAGTGVPGGPTTAVQTNAAGSFGGSANLTYASQLLTSIAASSSVAGIAVGTGFMQADAGFVATASCINFNCFQAPNGGMYAISMTAFNYVQTGNHAGPPSVTPSDTFHAGAMFYDTSASCEKVHNGTSFVCLASGGVTSVNTLTGAITLAGTTNRVIITPGGSTLTFSTPQDIATTSGPTFANVTANGVFQSTVVGINVGLQVNGGTFSVNGNGTVSAAGVVTTAAGLNVITTTASNSIQSTGGALTTGYFITHPSSSRVTFNDAAGTAKYLLSRSFFSGNAQEFYLYDNARAAFNFFFDSTGQMGVNTGSPAATLDVNGSVRVTSFTCTGSPCPGGGISSISSQTGPAVTITSTAPITNFAAGNTITLACPTCVTTSGAYAISGPITFNTATNVVTSDSGSGIVSTLSGLNAVFKVSGVTVAAIGSFFGGGFIQVNTAGGSNILTVNAGGIFPGVGTGLNCSGAPTGAFATINGIVTHC